MPFSAAECESWVDAQEFASRKRTELCRKMACRLELAPPATFLDLGCGPGFNLSLLARIAPRGIRMIGLDGSSAALHHARRSLPRSTTLVCADFDRGLPFEAGSIDAVLVAFAIHHSSSPAHFLAETRRILRARGRICIATMSHQQIESFFLRAVFPEAVACNLARYPGIEELKLDTERAGFTGVYNESFEFVHRASLAELRRFVAGGSSAMHGIPLAVRLARVDHYFRDTARNGRCEFTTSTTLVSARADV